MGLVTVGLMGQMEEVGVAGEDGAAGKIGGRKIRGTGEVREAEVWVCGVDIFGFAPEI